MTTFQQIALLLALMWIVIVVVRFRRSRIILIGGLFIIGLYTLVAFVYGKVSTMHLQDIVGKIKSWNPC